jgi:hypothetical protein
VLRVACKARSRAVRLRFVVFSSIEIKNPQVRKLSPTSAVIVARVRIEAAAGEQNLSTETLTSSFWVKQDGKWLAQLHTSTMGFSGLNRCEVHGQEDGSRNDTPLPRAVSPTEIIPLAHLIDGRRHDKCRGEQLPILADRARSWSLCCWREVGRYASQHH